jgi:hypothetical protein
MSQACRTGGMYDTMKEDTKLKGFASTIHITDLYSLTCLQAFSGYSYLSLHVVQFLKLHGK